MFKKSPLKHQIAKFALFTNKFGWTKKNLLERDLNLQPPDWRAGAPPTELSSPTLAQTDRNIETPSQPQQFFLELPHGATASFTSSPIHFVVYFYKICTFCLWYEVCIVTLYICCTLRVKTVEKHYQEWKQTIIAQTCNVQCTQTPNKLCGGDYNESRHKFYK